VPPHRFDQTVAFYRNVLAQHGVIRGAESERRPEASTAAGSAVRPASCM
jgi:hypothetical protein